MAVTTSLMNILLNAVFRGDSYTGGSIEMGLLYAGDVEVSGGSYARQPLSFSAASAKLIEADAVTFSDLPIGQKIEKFSVYSDNVLIDEGVIGGVDGFTPTIESNSLTLEYTCRFGA